MNMARGPMTPPECDLRNFPSMMLDVMRLRDSDLAAHPNAEVFRASVLSWCASWHQIPAGSLPDDDAALARLLGYGREVKKWQKVRAAGGLDGWVKCSDGRLYHPVVAEKAQRAWEQQMGQRSRTEAARRAKMRKAAEASVTNSVTEAVTDPVTGGVTEAVTDDLTDIVTASKVREGKEREGRKKDSFQGSKNSEESRLGSGEGGVPAPAGQPRVIAGGRVTR